MLESGLSEEGLMKNVGRFSSNIMRWSWLVFVGFVGFVGFELSLGKMEYAATVQGELFCLWGGGGEKLSCFILLLLLAGLAQQFMGLTDDKVRLSSCRIIIIHHGWWFYIFGLGKANKSLSMLSRDVTPFQARF